MNWGGRLIAYFGCFAIAYVLSILLIWMNSSFMGYFYGIDIKHADGLALGMTIVLSFVLFYFVILRPDREN